MGSGGFVAPFLVMRRINGHPQVNKGTTQLSDQSHHGVGGLKALTGTHDMTHVPREEMTSPILGESLAGNVPESIAAAYWSRNLRMFPGLGLVGPFAEGAGNTVWKGNKRLRSFEISITGHFPP